MRSVHGGPADLVRRFILLETVTLLSCCPTGSLLYDPLCEKNNKQDRLSLTTSQHFRAYTLCALIQTSLRSSSEKKKKKPTFFGALFQSFLPTFDLKIQETSPFQSYLRGSIFSQSSFYMKNFSFRDTDLAAFHCMGRLI